MSKLEFISSIKWPVTVLLLAAMATVLLKKNPETRKSLGTWFSRRNLRVNLVGQEFEATVVETQGSIGAATSPDSELAEAAARSAEVAREEQPPGSSPTAQEVENSRRETVGALARNAVRLGWLWARGEQGASEPVTSVTWDRAGNPRLRVMAKQDVAAEVQRVLNENWITLDREQLEALRIELVRRLRQPDGQPSTPHPGQGHATSGGDAAP